MEQTIQEKIELYKAQEDALHFPAFDKEMAWDLGCLLHDRAAALGYHFAMGIHLGDVQVFSYVFPKRVLAQSTWVRRKTNTVLHCGYSSIRFTAETEAAGKTFEELGLDLAVYGNSGGGFPIFVEGQGVVGAVAVSGLPAEVDHQFIVDTLTEYLKTL